MAAVAAVAAAAASENSYGHMFADVTRHSTGVPTGMPSTNPSEHPTAAHQHQTTAAAHPPSVSPNAGGPGSRPGSAVAQLQHHHRRDSEHDHLEKSAEGEKSPQSAETSASSLHQQYLQCAEPRIIKNYDGDSLSAVEEHFNRCKALNPDSNSNNGERGKQFILLSLNFDSVSRK